MAYNPYFPPTYQPNWNLYPQTYQPPQQPQPQQNQATSGIIWVSGINEAQMFPVAPNNAVALWEQNGKVIHLKSADATGKPTLKTYDLVERTQGGSDASSTTADKTIDYVSKEELTKISDVLETIRGDLETMKGDLYGAVGRKKKKEMTEYDE